jgi:phosphoribosylformylglycinamidine (FGAM) synthase-like enzyme
MKEQQIDYEQAEALGISHEAYDEVLDIVGRIPTIEELSTLLAMWESNGRQQSLYGWLRGQHHSVERNEYLYSGSADHKAIKEPKVKECVEIAHRLCHDLPLSTSLPTLNTGTLLYMVGNVSTEFADSEYARRCLHLVDEPMAAAGHNDNCQYIELILSALAASGMLEARAPVAGGGLFGSLLRFLHPLGFDILAPREVRLDAFLFGEEPGRYLVALPESQDDTFLLKMDEARLNCCFLGRTTKNRILVDGFDFGPVGHYLHPEK